jgi:hypothetical protein
MSGITLFLPKLLPSGPISGSILPKSFGRLPIPGKK